MLKHMYSNYFSVHYDRERDERMFAVFDGASARPKKILGESRNLREGWLDIVLHRRVLIAMSRLRDLGSTLGQY